MNETRRQRLASVIQQELAMMISRELKDPRIPSLTVTKVEVTQEGDQATVFIAVLGASQDDSKEGRKQMKECLDGLASATGFLRRHLASVLDVRYIPALAFREDRGFENAQRVHQLLRTLGDELKPDVAGTPETTPCASEDKKPASSE